MNRAPASGEATKPRHLGDRYRLERVPIRDAGPRLHLDKDRYIALEGDDVDLALCTTPVALEHNQAGDCQILHGQKFAAPSQ
jgi:hypothetical protein